MTYTPYPTAAAEAADTLRMMAGEADARADAIERRGIPRRLADNGYALAEEFRRAADWLDQQADEDEYAPPDSLGFTLPGDQAEDDEDGYDERDPVDIPAGSYACLLNHDHGGSEGRCVADARLLDRGDANPGGGDHIPARRPVD